MEREIALDTETTGLDPKSGHRIVEIGCVEMINRIPTGKHFHVYINPERSMPEEAFKIHGISEDFLHNKPIFSHVVDDFLAFINNARLIIHNADFDIKFLNAELFHARKPEIQPEAIFCTLKYARKLFPGSPSSLDALCKRFGIDNSNRQFHGALLDAELLAHMYLELMGGSQVTLSLEKQSAHYHNTQVTTQKDTRPPRLHTPTEHELSQHQQFLKKIPHSLWIKETQ